LYHIHWYVYVYLAYYARYGLIDVNIAVDQSSRKQPLLKVIRQSYHYQPN